MVLPSKAFVTVRDTSASSCVVPVLVTVAVEVITGAITKLGIDCSITLPSRTISPEMFK